MTLTPANEPAELGTRSFRARRLGNYAVPPALSARLNNPDRRIQDQAAEELGAFQRTDAALRARCDAAAERWWALRRPKGGNVVKMPKRQ